MTQDALDLLEADHEAIETLLAQYEAEASRLAPADRALLANAICEQLELHGRLEEEIFYPAALACAAALAPLLADAADDHLQVCDQIARIRAADPASPGYDALLATLAGQFRDHVRMEEEVFFPELDLSPLDLAGIGRQLEERRAELDAGGAAPAPHLPGGNVPRAAAGA
jgi:hypothetical protein